MAVSFGSINTGLPKDIVQKIVEAEKIPIEKLNVRKEKLNDKLKLMNELIGYVQELRDAQSKTESIIDLNEFKVLFNEEIVDVTVDKFNVKPGTYSLEVQQLAQNSSAMSVGLPDKNETYLGVGFIEYELPNGEEKSIYIDSDNSTLEGVAKLINQDEEIGMRATVINDGSGSDAPWRLILTIEDTGNSNNAEFPYFYLIDGEEDFFLDEERNAKNAIVKLDGFEFAIENNKSSDIIPGLAIDFKKAKPGEEFNISVISDPKAILEKIDSIVAALNKVLGFIIQQNTLDKDSDTSRTLGGNISLQSLESRIRNLIFSQVTTSEGPVRISDLGVSFQRNGLLKLEPKKMEGNIANNFQKVAEFFTGYYDKENEVNHLGFVKKMKKVVTSSLRYPDGLLNSNKNGITSRINQIDRQISEKERQLKQKEERLKLKFSRLESTMSRLRTQGQGMAAIAAQAGSFNPVQNLG